MAKQVLVSITGNQFKDADGDKIEIVTVADYYKRNGRHFIIFYEMPEDEQAMVKNTIRFDENFFEITKKGAVNTHFLFQPQESISTYYTTTAGPLNVNVTTTAYRMTEQEQSIDIYIKYYMDIQFAYSIENEVRIHVIQK